MSQAALGQPFVLPQHEVLQEALAELAELRSIQSNPSSERVGVLIGSLEKKSPRPSRDGHRGKRRDT